MTHSVRNMEQAEKAYTLIDKEALALYWKVRKFYTDPVRTQVYVGNRPQTTY